MSESTAEDWRIISTHTAVAGARCLTACSLTLRLLDGDCGGFAVDRLTHSLQTATRAERAGRDDEYVLCALIHDIGDTLGPYGTPRSPPPSSSPTCTPTCTGWSRSTACSRATTSSTTSGSIAICATSSRPPALRPDRGVLRGVRPGGLRPGVRHEPLEHFEPLVRALMAGPRQSLYTGPKGTDGFQPGLPRRSRAASAGTLDRHRAFASLQEELEAGDWYDQRVDAAQDEELKAILAHNRDEKEHAAMLLKWLRRRDPKLDEHLRTYLFTNAPILEIEKADS